MNKLVPYIEENMNQVRIKLSEVPNIRCMKNEGTYLMWIDCRELGSNEDKINQSLIESGVALQMGSTYGPAGRGFVRMNVAAPRSVVAEGADRVSRGFRNLLSTMSTSR